MAMKSEQDIRLAHESVSQARVVADDEQDLVLCGMSVALSWVEGSPRGSSLQRLIDDELPEAIQ